jgi:hypothetical protein
MTVPESTPRDDTESPADQQQRLLSPWERPADNAFLALLNAADDYADGDLIVGNLYALHSAVTAVWKGDMEYLQAERDTARNRVTALEKNGAELLARAERAEAANDAVRALAEQATHGGFGKLCCCFDCEDAQENGRDAPHEPTWTAWTLDPAEVLAALGVTETTGGES